MTGSHKFPGNRFTVLEEVQELLGFGRVELLAFLEALAKADDGYLQYDFGTLHVAFTVNDGLLGCVLPDEHDTIYKRNPRKTIIGVSLTMETDHAETSTTYSFSLPELRGLCCAKQRTIESFGDS